MRIPLLGEFMGTMMMILLGDGVVAARAAQAHQGRERRLDGHHYRVGVRGAVRHLHRDLFGSKDAHLNPAITLAFAFQTGNFSKLAVYVPAQVAGAFVAAVLVWLFYLPHWKVSEEPATSARSSAPCPPSATIRQTFSAKSSPQLCW